MMNQMASKMKNYFVNENNIKIENEVYENKLEGKPHNTPGAKSVILPLLSKSPKSIKSPKSNFKDMNFGKEEHTVKIVPMRKGNENPFASPKIKKYGNSGGGNKVTYSLDASSLIEVLNQQTSEMLFGYEPNSSGGKFIQNRSIDANHYNRFYMHFEKEKERQSFHNKKVRFSKEAATPKDYE